MKLGLSNIHIQDRGRTLVRTREFSLDQNKVTFLFGESGIGKSLLSRAVYGLLDPGVLDIASSADNYAAYLENPGVKELIAGGFFVFQEPSSHLNSLLSITEQLNEGSLASASNETDILKEMWGPEQYGGLNNILKLYPKPHRPSGGEKQRLLLAMAFKKLGLYRGGPGIFVFDEPTGSLDNHYRNIFLKMLLDRFAQVPFTALLITHDYSIISEINQTYPHLRDKVAFRELSRLGDNEVTLRDFSPDLYMNWLSQVRGHVLPPGREGEVLRVRSQLAIFGRQLQIFSDAQATRPADLVLHPGETVYLKAPSGTGKTTLAKIVMGLFKADQVAMTLAGTELNEKTPEIVWQKHLWGRTAGMVFQHADEALNLEANIRETFVGLPLEKSLTSETLRAALAELFEEEITPEFLKKKVARLSGGQKQRLNLLRTLILEPKLVILDEPLNGLDFESIKKVLSILEDMAAKGCAFLMISHNEEIFESYVDESRVFYLRERT